MQGLAALKRWPCESMHALAGSEEPGHASNHLAGGASGTQPRRQEDQHWRARGQTRKTTKTTKLT